MKRSSVPRLVRVVGDAGEIMAGGKKGVTICSNALLIKPGIDWCVCTVFNAGEDRYLTTEVKASAVKRAIRSRAAIGKSANYKKALAAATDMAMIGIGTMEMAVAWGIHEATDDLVRKAKSDVVRDCVADDLEELYRLARGLAEYMQDPPEKIARAIVECYVDCDMDVKKVQSAMSEGTFSQIYML